MNNCTCDVFPDYLMERVWQVSCSQVGSQPMDDYYTKEQTNARIKQAKDDVEQQIQELSEEVASGQTDIQDEIDALETSKADKADVYGKQETDAKLALKANLSDVYSKDDMDGLLSQKASTATTTDLQNQINNKQDTLVSGTNIKTLNGESILGQGDIVITGGSGVTSGEVETMIDAAVSGKQDTSGMTAYTLTSTTDAINNIVTAHTSDNSIHVSAIEKSNWNAKLDPSALNGYATQQWVGQQGYLTGYTESDPVFTGSPAYSITNADKNTWNTVTGKADSTAVTAVNNALTGHTADTTVHTNSAEKTAWNGAATNATQALTQLNGYTITAMSKEAYENLQTKDAHTIYFLYD